MSLGKINKANILDEILGCIVFTIGLGGDACNPRYASVITDVAYKL